jgi:hypothetical protein
MHRPKTEMGKSLDISCTQDEIRKILAVGHEFDINKGGYYDARSGCVNFWAGPEDKPTCWDKKILQGALDYPRDYVGGLYWEYNEEKNQFDLYINVTPYCLLDTKKSLTEKEWQELIDWTEKQARGILRLAKMHEDDLGTCCPFCEYVLPLKCLLNDLLDHITLKHKEIELKGLTIGCMPVIETNKGLFTLKKKTDI